MWRVVNQDGGTAYNHARLVKGEWELCGKTGSAQAMPRVISRDYTFGWPDGRREVIRAGSAEEAEQTLRRKYPTAFDRSPLVVADVAAPPAPARLIGAKVAERYPSWQPDEKLPSHAWFVGWLQSSKTPRGEKPVGRSIAISVVIEYGDAGGRKAGPVAKRIAEGLIRRGID
ncbi:MAG: hypothetical protein HZB38_05445 [Planctomycetes bacterium]|nr:hypothetical protein [Planctomycetota bacterium]